MLTVLRQWEILYTVMGEQYGQRDLTPPLDGTLARTYRPPCHFTGMDDRYSAKAITGTNRVRHGRHISAKECQFDLSFPCQNREKRLYCVVWFTSAEFYGFGKRVERKQKGPSLPAPDVFATKQPPLYLLIPPPCTSVPKWAESTDSHAHTEILYTFNRHLRHFRRGLQYLQKTLTWSHALDNMGVCDPRLGLDESLCRSSEPTSAGINVSRRVFKWFMLSTQWNSLKNWNKWNMVNAEVGMYVTDIQKSLRNNRIID